MSKTRNRLFNPKNALDRGKPQWFEALWYFIKIFFFLSSVPWPSRFKCAVLRCFGANIGVGVIIKPRVNIHFPWKLIIGDNSWIGEEVFILNFEKTIIGSNCCISQRAFICCGNHDYKKIDMPYRNGPISILDGVWVGAQSFVGPGVTIHEDAVVTVGSLVIMDVPAAMVCSGTPCRPVRNRW